MDMMTFWVQAQDVYLGIWIFEAESQEILLLENDQRLTVVAIVLDRTTQ